METEATTDLLTLIGRAIQRLQRSITLLEAEERDGSSEQINSVIEEIDAYIEVSESDPLLRLASLPPSHVRDGLLHVRSDLESVIDELGHDAH